MFADLCYFSVRSVQVMNHVYVLSIMASGWNSFTSFVISTYILMKLRWFVCRLHFYFLFCRAYYWVIWVKLHTLWNTMLMLVKPFFLLFQVGVSMFACFTMARLHTSHQLRCNAILYLQVVHSGQLFSSPTLLH